MTNQHPILRWWVRLRKHRDARSLWRRYCVALFCVAGLILITHHLTATNVQGGLSAAQSVTLLSQQGILADSLVDEAGRITAGDRAGRADYTAKLASFTQLVQATPHAEPALALRVQGFLAAAQRFAITPAEEQARLQRQMYDMLSTGGLREALLQASDAAAGQLRRSADRFAVVQRLMLLAAACVLLIEAMFIFWPAQRLVSETIDKLRAQTRQLRRSQCDLREKTARLDHLLVHDQLTGLPNRTSLARRLDALLKDARDEGWTLYLIGLDHLKALNEAHGHDVGDALLVAVAEALRNCVDADHMAARIGGDEFVILSPEPVPAVLHRIGTSLQRPLPAARRQIRVQASVGYVAIDRDIADAGAAIANAEAALRQVKADGGQGALAYSAALRDGQALAETLKLDLTEAIGTGQIEPWFQPQISLADGHLRGAEVLVRWRHPSRGLLPPQVFLPIAERAGLMADLDHAVWDQAIGMARGWRDAGLWEPVLSLNAAPETIADPQLIERFLISLHRHGLDAGNVLIEVIEATLIDSKNDMAALNLDGLAEAGIRLELDDFGTGYGYLAKLMTLPIAGIKLDRSLIAPLPEKSTDTIVRAMLALAHELGLHVVAEGIEEPGQMHLLGDLGCGFGQGYGFARPMPPDEFAVWLAQHAGVPVRLAGPDDSSKLAQA